MFQPGYSPSFSAEEYTHIRNTFRKHDKNKDGFVSDEEFKELCTELNLYPEPFQVGRVFEYAQDGDKLSEDMFLTWFCGFSVGLPDLALGKFQMMKFEQGLRAAAAAPAAPSEAKESFVRLQLENNTEALPVQFRVKTLINKQLMLKQHAQYSQLFGRTLSDVFFAYKFAVTTNTVAIVQKLREIIAIGMEFLKQLIADKHKLISVSVANTGNTIIIVAEFNYPLIGQFERVFQSILEALSPQAMLYFSMGLRMSNNFVPGKDINELNLAAELELKIDGTLMNRLKDYLKNNIESIMNSDPTSLIMLFLFEELKVEMKFKDPKSLLQELGLPTSIPALPPNPQLPKSDQQLQQMMDGFVPGSHSLLKLIMSSAAAYTEFGLYSRSASIHVQVKAQDITKYLDFIIN